jgi:hypothetical protein
MKQVKTNGVVKAGDEDRQGGDGDQPSLLFLVDYRILLYLPPLDDDKTRD